MNNIDTEIEILLLRIAHLHKLSDQGQDVKLELIFTKNLLNKFMNQNISIFEIRSYNMDKSFKVLKDFALLQPSYKNISKYSDLILDEISCLNIRDILENSIVTFYKEDKWKFILTNTQQECLFKNEDRSIVILDIIYNELINNKYIEVSFYESDDTAS